MANAEKKTTNIKMTVNESPDNGQSKVLRLFTYLEKALALEDTVIRDFRPTTISPSPWWLADFPNDIESLHIKSFETEENVDDGIQKDVWLRVNKENIEAAPLLPKKLVEWVDEVNPLKPPLAKEKISRQILFNDDQERVKLFKEFIKQYSQGDQKPRDIEDWIILSPNKLPEYLEFQYVDDIWEDHQELKKLLDNYIEKDWRPWSEKVSKIYKANLLYDELYALRLLLKNEGDSYELLLGHGMLTWDNSTYGKICSPIFLTPLVIDFDASRRSIELSPDPMFRGFTEISCLYEMNNPAEMDLITWSDKINSNPFDFWHLESSRIQSQTFLNYLSPNSEDSFSDTISSSPVLTTTPTIWNSPVIFARKRSNDLWSKYAGIIRRDIEQNNVEPTEFIKDLVGESSEVDSNSNTDNENISISESELLFPLPWNEEQKRIAERLEPSYGVVVKGPPGTGKSHTIANLIARFLSQGKTVLVTSQTSKALEVLRDKLPENIRSLAVSQLHQTAKRDDVLQQSISEISSNLGERNTKFSEDRAEAVRKELQSVREKRAGLANQIRQFILIDSNEKIIIDGEEIKPIDAAKIITKYGDDESISWFTDRIDHNLELNFSDQELNELYQLLLELKPSERGLYNYDFPPMGIIPSEDIIESAFDSYQKLKIKVEAQYELEGEFNRGEELIGLFELLSSAKKVLLSLDEDYKKEIFEICCCSATELEKWKTVITMLSEKITLLGKINNALLGHNIVEEKLFQMEMLLEGIQAIKSKLVNRSKLGPLAKITLPLSARKVLANFRVDGYSPDNKEQLEILINYAQAKKLQREIVTLTGQSFSKIDNPPKFKSNGRDFIQLEILINDLQRIVNYDNDFAIIKDFCGSVNQLSELSFTKLSDIENLLELISSRISSNELENLEEMFNKWYESINQVAVRGRHEVIKELLAAIKERNFTASKKAIDYIYLLTEKKEKSLKLKEIADKVKNVTPNLYQDITDLADSDKKFECPDNLSLVWKVSRLESWLNSIHDHSDIGSLQSELERLTKREQELNANLVTILSWQRQIDRVTKRQRDALMAWSDSMKKYGKGTGKYANKWLHAAQEALGEAKNAVPVWIMPLHRVAQMFSDPKAGMFDVVIFDEASQCDIRGLTIAYLGKKLLIVGDPDQISPAGIFQNLEKGFELISRFLFDIPHKDIFSVTSSLFGLAQIRIPNMIQLNEHFRCVPEIIAFSNHYIYDGKLKPLRHPNPKGLLKPALVPIYIQDGLQNTNNKVNEPEAKAIVEKLVECLDNPLYQKRPDGHLCTFGIVSLLAEDQAKYIKELILKHPRIGEKIIEERKIICGDAYAFQGDERDVMFLSMVKALDPNNLNDTVRALTDQGTAQRFNVAQTRARDQVFLFHSIPLQEFRNQDDWRYRLMNWFYNPKTEELNAGRDALLREFNSGRASQFSFDVGNLIIDRGYKVLPEYPVIGYRIDLVIQGDESRLAVECDGDQYHTLEKWEEDQFRERQLRRAGWEFWRVTGSAFYHNKEKSLDSLWDKLEELGIKPI